MGIAHSKPEGIFFDWDGTLVDSLGFLTHVHNHVKSLFDLPSFQGDEYLKYLGMPREQIFVDIYGTHSEAAKKEFESYYFQNYLSDIIVFDGALNMLEYIYSLDIPMGVVSNKNSKFLHAEVQHLGWQKYFGTCVIGSGDTKSDKPDAAPLIHALTLKSKSINHKNIWYIGDTEIDAQCSYNLGCKSIVISSHRKIIEDKLTLEELRNTIFVKKYEEICGFLLH